VDERREIVHVLPGAPFGGLQVIIVELARAQIRAGRKVTLALTDRSSRIAECAVASGIPVRTFGGGRLCRTVALALWLASRGHAIVHSHCEPIWATLCLAILRLPYWIAHLHTYAQPRDTLKERLMHRIHRRCVARFIAITRSVGQSYLDRDYATEETLDVVYNGLQYARSSEPEEGAHFSVCFAGRIVAEKGIFDFVSLAERLRDQPGIRFVVAGTGSDLDEARRRAAMAGLDGRIEFLGFVDDMSSFWSSASVFLMLSDQEPFGLVILEALAHGVAVLGYDTPSGGREIMVQIPGCRLARRGSIEDLAAAVLDLKRNRAETANEVKAGQQVIRQSFSIERMEAGTAAVYAKLGPGWPGV
jgi:glycosyltransferase involved in cell wall biosynthesis